MERFDARQVFRRRDGLVEIGGRTWILVYMTKRVPRVVFKLCLRDCATCWLVLVLWLSAYFIILIIQPRNLAAYLYLHQSGRE